MDLKVVPKAMWLMLGLLLLIAVLVIVAIVNHVF